MDQIDPDPEPIILYWECPECAARWEEKPLLDYCEHCEEHDGSMVDLVEVGKCEECGKYKCVCDGGLEEY